MQERVDVDILVVGAGIVGLAIAKVLRESFPHKEIVVIDKMAYLGEHASGRNSGVLHAGLYYPNNSLKKQLCLRGNELWREWASQINTTINPCGKYILATKDEQKAFEQLMQRARKNGAEVELVAERQLTEITPFSPASFAFFSPNTAVIDPSDTIKKLGQYVESLGVMLLLNHQLTEIKREDGGYSCWVNDFIVSSKVVINAAGAGSIKLRKQLGLKDLELRLVKGHYLKTFSTFYNQALLYRLPEKNLTGLGIHTCIDFDGTVKFGPDTQEVESVDYSLDEQYIERMKEQVVEKFSISQDKLHGDFAGIRTKIKLSGKLYSDFWIKSPLPQYIELCGIESPGLTSAPAIAEYLHLHFFDKVL
jgi:L-2-hydroxyglutarate oxidase LhgO